MKNEVAVFTTNDLQSAGINSQLTSNDLVEVVAHDIYDKYVDMVTDIIKRGNELEKEHAGLMDVEIGKMKKAVSKYINGAVKVVDEDDIDDEDEATESINGSFGKVEGYWPTTELHKLGLNEREKGTFIESRVRSLYIPSFKSKTSKVKLTLASGQHYDEQKVTVGNISGTINTTVDKKFTQVVTIPITRFKNFHNKCMEFNKEVEGVLSFLPKNGALSVERFTREARVKMNKKIISAQSPEFRKKISELFNIKL